MPEVAAGPGLVGRTLGGRYLVKRVLGEGGMGMVYEAEQRMGDGVRRVAIKTLLPELAEDRKLKERFLRECSTVSQLEHPNTIRFYDFGESDGVLYVAMEFVKGKSLGDLVSEGPQPAERVAHIVRQIAGALDEAHSLGIIHRDLKPDNVILTRRGDDDDTVKLLDFGIATRELAREPGTKLTEQGLVLGTPPYMSPEQLAGEQLDRRSDVYSLGIIAYELLNGQLPFVAATPYEWATQHMTQPPRVMRSVVAGTTTHEVERVVLRALAKRREERPSTAGELARDLAAAARSSLPGGKIITSPMDAGPHTSGTESALPVPAALRAPHGVIAAPYTPYVAPSALPAPVVRTEAPFAAPVLRPEPRGARGPSLLVIALSTVALLSGAGVLALALKQRSTGDTPTDLATGGPTPTTTVTAETPTDTTSTVGPDPTSTAGPTSTIRPRSTSATPTGTPSSTSTVTAPATTSTAPPPPPPPTTSTAEPTPPAPTINPSGRPRIGLPLPTATTPAGSQGDAACADARAQASGGNIESAAASLRRCQSTGGSAGAIASARAAIAARAPAEVTRRGYNGDCTGAKRVADAARSVGAGAGVAAALKTGGC